MRRWLYWALFAGACGHTYGCHDIWQFWEPERIPIAWPRTPWREALQLEGAQQMRYARKLLESHPVLTHIPDQTLIVGDNPQGATHIQATRGESGEYALVYLPPATSAVVDMAKLQGPKIRVSWFNPRNGQTQIVYELALTAAHKFTPPTAGEMDDWILVLDSIEAGS